ncbi:MAG: SDR family oxidoreductase [Bacteroidia bacterium]
MKILVTGSNGLLGQKLVYGLRAIKDVELIATSKGKNRISEKSGYVYEEMDITDKKAIGKIFEKHKPGCIINTAAMTNVDACELNKDECLKLNVEAVKHISIACKKYNTHFIHLSTDFVFDGENGPYKEDDVPNPQSFYASSKLESEIVVQSAGIDWCIIRTIIIYGVTDDEQRSNVVLWTKNSLELKKTITVITDQFRSPTLAEDLAAACISAAIKRAKGIYHVSGKELMSIIEVANKVADFFHLDKSFIKPVTSAELNQPAKRPPKTGFILDKAIRDLDYKPHTFEEGLKIVAGQLSLKSKERN